MPDFIQKFTVLFFCAVAAFFVVIAPRQPLAEHASDHGSLTFSVHPYLPASELTRRFSPLAQEIGIRIGHPVKLVIQPSYEDHVAEIGRDRVDFAFIGPAAYVRMIDEYGQKPLLGRISVAGSPLLHGSIVVREGSKFKNISDLEGSKFAFGSVDSTMSHLVPRYVIEHNGVTLGDHSFLGAHVNVALGVLMGHFDAGAVKQEVLDEYYSRGLRRLVALPPVPEHLFVARAGLDEAIMNKLRQAFQYLNADGKGLKALSLIADGVDGILPAEPGDYDELGEILRRVAP